MMNVGQTRLQVYEGCYENFADIIATGLFYKDR